MTADVFDRLLEHALRDELAPHAPPASTADLVARVVAALEGRDARRSPAPPVRHACERARRRWLPFAIAAAAGVGVALTWLAAKQPGLSCSRALLLAAADDQPFTAGTHVAARSFVWCTGAAAVVLTAGDGTAATAAPGSVFAIDPQRCSAELFAGALELRGRRAPWRVDAAGVGDVAVFVAAGGTVRCTLTPEVPPQTDPDDPTMTPNELCARLRDLAVPTTLTVLVLAGTAELATAQGREPLPAGGTRTIDAGTDRAAFARTRQLYEQVRKELPPPTDEASIAARKELEDGFHELMVLALSKPRCAAMLRGPITQDLADERLAAEPRARVLQLALLDEDAATFTTVTRDWSLHPDRFGFEEQVALAERGFEPAKAKLRESLTRSRGVGIARVLSALTAGGDEQARVPLQRFLRSNLADAGKDSPRFDARCYSVAAMQAVGDPAPAQELRTALIAQVETWVASGDAQQLALADSCLQRAEYWLGSQQPRLAWPEIRVRAATPRRGEPDAASLRARAAALPAK